MMINLIICRENQFVFDCFNFFCEKFQNEFKLIGIDRFENISDIEINEPSIIIVSCSDFLRNYRVTVENSLLKILVFGKYCDLPSIKYFFFKGANCYLKNNESFESIYNALKIIYKSGIYCPYPFNIYNLNSELRIKIDFTAKELEIFHFLRKEMTNREISELCGIHIKTVEYHRKNIIDKCGSRNLLGALDYLIASGIIPIVDD